MTGHQNGFIKVGMKSSSDTTPSAHPAPAILAGRSVQPTRPTRASGRSTQRPGQKGTVVCDRGQGLSGSPETASHRPDSDLLASVMEQATVIERPKARPADPAPESAITWTLPGFDRRCRVSTNFGELPIKALRRRDMVRTLSGAFREVKWVDAIRLDAEFMARHPEAHPVQLRAKALGPGQPGQNILVSPAQKISAQGLIGNMGIATAAEYEKYPNIARLPQMEMVYYRFHCGEPETVRIEGAWFCIAP